MENVAHLAGISFDPAIRGVLVALTGFLILCGSVYLILGTNVGARLGFLLAAGGLAGWMFILGLTWWFFPPAIGPRGTPPAWEVQDIVFGDPAASSVEAAQTLPNICWSSESRDCELVGGESVSATLLSENTAFQDEGDEATLSELKAVDTEGALEQVDTADWELVSTSDAGEAVSAADEALVEAGVFESSADYVVLDGFEIGGKDQLDDDANAFDRALYKVTSTAQLTHPTHYALVQLQPVVPQEAEPGEAPPPPLIDVDAPTVSVVLIRDLGNVRVPGFLVTLGSGILLAVLAYALHRRDQLADEHRAAAGS